MVSDRRSLFVEVKRRKVVRVGVVCLAVAWAAVQVADVFVPALGLPDTVVTTVAFLVILGFPAALVLAWAFDVTPRGLERTASPDGASPEGHAPGWVGAGTVTAAVALIAVGFLAGRLVGGAGPADSELDRLAVAVLPFESRGTADDIGFADGVHDDILTQLSRIDALRVTSRTSVEAYRVTDKNMRTIASELGVGTVLEGGVQRTGDRVRINIQLIDGGTDEHLWAESFDRPLTAENVFAIQSEIARAVANALEATLTADDESQLALIPTTNLEALALYHRGVRLSDDLRQDGRAEAVSVLEQAVALDPAFARAWAELTMARSWEIREGRIADTLPSYEAMARTVELAPGSIEAALATGHYRYYAHADYEGALSAFRRAAARANDVDLMLAMANVLRRLGRHDEAAALFQQVAELEPSSPRALYELAWGHLSVRRFEEARVTYELVQALADDDGQIVRLLAEVALLGSGDVPRAESIVQGEIDRGNDMTTSSLQLAYFRRDVDALDSLAAQAIEVVREQSQAVNRFASYELYPDGPPEIWVARMYWTLGDPERARDLSRGLAEAYAQRTPVVQAETSGGADGVDVFGVRAWELAFQGRAEEAQAQADRAVELHGHEHDKTDGSLFQRQRPLIRIVTGDLDGAMEDLRFLLSVPGRTTKWELRLDPIYDPLRDRADFQALIAD